MELSIAIDEELVDNCVNGVAEAGRRPETKINEAGEVVPNISKEEFLTNIVESFLAEHCVADIIKASKTALETAIVDAKAAVEGKISVSIKYQ